MQFIAKTRKLGVMKKSKIGLLGADDRRETLSRDFDSSDWDAFERGVKLWQDEWGSQIFGKFEAATADKEVAREYG